MERARNALTPRAPFRRVAHDIVVVSLVSSGGVAPVVSQEDFEEQW